MKRMSFSATPDQMHSRQKTVTRRHWNTWKGLEPGDRLLAIEKGMGLQKGEKQTPIGEIEIVSNEVVYLHDLDALDVELEGFPGKTPEWFFAEVWAPLNGVPKPYEMVRRIEFRHR